MTSLGGYNYMDMVYYSSLGEIVFQDTRDFSQHPQLVIPVNSSLGAISSVVYGMVADQLAMMNR